MKVILWWNWSNDDCYWVMKVIKWWMFSSDESYLVMKVRMVKEVKRSDGLWRFACGDVFFFSAENPASQRPLLAMAVALIATSWWATSARSKKASVRSSSVSKTLIVKRTLAAFCLARCQQFSLSWKYLVPGDGLPVLPQLCGFKRNCSILSKDWRLYPCPWNDTGHFF